MQHLLKKLIISLLFAFLLSGCEFTPPGGENTLKFNIVFEDAKGLTVGTPLVFQGVVIGDVTGITLMPVQAEEIDAPCKLTQTMIEKLSRPQVACISIAVDESNRNLVHTDSDFMLQDARLVSVTAEKQVEMTVWDSESPTLADHSTVLGSDNLLDLYWKRVERWEQGLALGELSISTDIGVDGTVKRAYTLATAQYLPVEAILDGLLPVGEAGWESSRPEQSDVKLLKAVRVFPSAAGVISKNSNVSIEANETMFGGEYIYTETFQPGQFRGNQDLISVFEWRQLITDWYDRILANQEDTPGILWEAIVTLIDQFETGVSTVLPLNRIGTVVTVTMPGEVVTAESNATFVAGNQASWILTVEDLNQGFEARSVARRGFFSSATNGAVHPGWIVGGIVILIVSGSIGTYFWHLKRQADISIQRELDEVNWDE